MLNGRQKYLLDVMDEGYHKKPPMTVTKLQSRRDYEKYTGIETSHFPGEGVFEATSILTWFGVRGIITENAVLKRSIGIG